MIHVTRVHIPKEAVPFRCTLCDFRSLKEKQYRDHLRTFKPRVKRVEEMESCGLAMNSDTFLSHATLNLTLSPEQLERLSVVESLERWNQRGNGG